MSKRAWSIAAAVVAGVVVVSGLAVASTTVQRAHGRFTDVDSTRREAGHWNVAVATRTSRRGGSSQEADRIEAYGKHLDVSGATATSRPSFHVWLVTSDASTSADFGAMRVNRRGNAAFIFDTRGGSSLPSGVTSLTSFSGGTIEIRDGSGTVVLSSTLP
jgi:hypothetical protein